MKNLFIVIFMTFLSNISFSQKFEIYKGDTINRTDINNLKQGKWIYFNDNYTGKILQKGTYKNNKKEGTWIVFYSNGKPKSIINYKNNKGYGEITTFYENGNIEEKGYWKINKWTGEYKYFFKNGKVKYHWFFDENGKRTGTQKYFFENGKKQIEGNWIQGKKDGEIKEYYSSGGIKKITNFSDGKINGSVTEYYSNGQIKTKSIFVNGKMNSTKSFAYSHPKKIEEKKENINNIEEEEEDIKNNSKAFKGTGYFKFLNKNGKVDREGDFVDGILIDGKQFIYNEDRVIKIIIIENGKIVKEDIQKNL